MRINWRNFLIGFTVFYALVKFLQFLYFLGYLIQDLLHQDDEDECRECIIQYLEIVFLSCLLLSILLLLYGAVKVNLQSLIKEVKLNKLKICSKNNLSLGSGLWFMYF